MKKIDKDLFETIILIIGMAIFGISILVGMTLDFYCDIMINNAISLGEYIIIIDMTVSVLILVLYYVINGLINWNK